MFESFSHLKYAGSTPGADANTYVLFATILPAAPTNAMNANWPAKAFQLLGVRKFCIDIDHVQAGTLNEYKSDDRGANWRQVSTEAVAAPAASGVTRREYLVEADQDWKLEWVNGGVAQNPWVVDMALSDDRTIS